MVTSLKSSFLLSVCYLRTPSFLRSLFKSHLLYENLLDQALPALTPPQRYILFPVFSLNVQHWGNTLCTPCNAQCSFLPPVSVNQLSFSLIAALIAMVSICASTDLSQSTYTYTGSSDSPQSCTGEASISTPFIFR